MSLILLGFWATEGVLHPFDSSTTTTAAVALLFMPGIGVMTWKEAQARIPWGTLVLFGIGISLGTALLQTKAATWLANLVVAGFGLDQLGGLAILAVLGLFLIIIHLGFASATALAASMIPIVIAVLQKVQTPGISIIGMVMVLQFVVSYGFVLPVNSPQGMVGYGTETFIGARLHPHRAGADGAGVPADPGCSARHIGDGWGMCEAKPLHCRSARLTIMAIDRRWQICHHMFAGKKRATDPVDQSGAARF